MLKLIHIILPTLAALAACATKPETLAANPFDQVFAPLFPADGPGCAMSAVRDGARVAEATYGLANLEQPAPIRIDTVFEAGSVSKQFTAAAIAILADRGALGLDDDVRTYLPELPDYGVPITIRQLLTHTSGVRNWDDLAELAGAPRGEGTFGQQDALDFIRRQSELNFVPGEEYLYSNSNYVLAAEIVARVSGLSFSAFSEREIFGPLGLSQTRWRDDHTRIVAGRAVAYTPGEDGALRLDQPIEDVIGPGGLLTTVGDLQLWNAALDTPPAGAAGWIALLNTARGALADGTPIRYGLGIEQEPLGQFQLLSHAGSTFGYRAYLAREPETRLSVAMLCNAGAINTEELGPQAVSLFLPAAEPAEVSGTGAAVDPPPGLAGLYRNVRTGAAVTLTADTAGIRFNGGAAFKPAGDDRLLNADGSREARITRGPGGEVASIMLTRVGNSPVRLEPERPWSPGRAELAAFEGRWGSAEVSGTWTIRLDGEALRADGPGRQSFFLDPAYADTFAARDAYWTFAFKRGAAGQPVSVRLYKTRTRGVLFERLAP